MANEAADGASPDRPPSTRGRRRIAIVLVVVASVLALPAILAIWANRQVLNTDAWTKTSTELLENKVIRDQLATYLVDSLYQNVDVEAELRAALPPRVQPLAGPAAGGLRELAERSAKRALARPRAQERWANANRAAHKALLLLLEGGGPTLSTEGGTVVLDLRSLLDQLSERVGVGGRLAGRLPPDAAQITILRSSQLESAQTGLKVLRGLPVVLVVLSLALFGAALAVAPDWRRKALRLYGFGFVAAGGLALLARSVGGDQLVDALGSTAAVKPAIAAAWEIATPLLVEAATATILYGLVMIAAAWLAGRSQPAVAVRRVMAPYIAAPAIAYGGLAAIVALLLWWGPTPALRKPWLALVLIALMAIGVEVLRRQTRREFPDAERAETMRWLRGGVDRGVDWARSGTSAGRTAVAGSASGASAPAGGGDAPADERVEQLERLARLKEAGVLDDAEFAEQKRRILAEPGPAPAGGDAPPVDGTPAPV